MDYQSFLLNLCELFAMGDAGLEDDVLVQGIMNMGEPSIYNIHRMKDRGNSLFKEGNLSLAVTFYNQALQLFCFLGISSPQDQHSAISLALSLVLNLAACELKLSHYNQAWCFCNLVLNFDPCNVKALYRSGLALQKSNFLVEALDDFEHALKLEPNNKDVSREFHYVVDCLALKPNGKRAAFQFDPLGNDRKGKKPLLVDAVTKSQALVEAGEASCSRGLLLKDEMVCDNNTSSRITAVVIESDSIAKTCTPSLVQCTSHPSVAKSTKCSFSNKNQTHKKLSLSSKDYDNLMSGKNLQFYHQKSGAYMKVRPLSSKTSILTGTLQESSSWEAVVPSVSPIPINMCPTTEFRPSEKLDCLVDEDVSHLNVKRPRLSQKESPNINNAVCEVVSTHSALREHFVTDVSSPLQNQSHFVFSALKMHAGSRSSNSRRSNNSRRSVKQPNASRRMGRDQAQLKNRSLMLVKGFVFCRSPNSKLLEKTKPKLLEKKTLDMVVSFKRKFECSIQFDNFYHLPFKKRRLSATGSYCNSTYASCFSTTFGGSLAPRFGL